MEIFQDTGADCLLYINGPINIIEQRTTHGPNKLTGLYPIYSQPISPI